MDKQIMNHNNSLDLSKLSESLSDTQSNTAVDFDASENCTLLLQNDKIEPRNGILHRIANFTKRGPRLRREFCDSDNDDDDKNGRFHTSSRKWHKRTVKRYLFLFGFVSILIIFSHLCLSMFNYEPDVEGWDRKRIRHTPTYILPHINTTILQPATLCRGNLPILLLIFVFSAPGNFEKRQMLRETWANTTEFNYSKFAMLHAHLNGTYLPINYENWRIFNENDIDDVNQANFRIRVVFLLGQTENNTIQEQIINESQTHDDLIQESFVDSYNNLTLKSVMMVKWVTSNGCEGKVSFVMKCDEDTFVNVPNLIHFLLGGTIPVLNATLPHYNERNVHTRLSINRFEYRSNVLVGLLLCHTKPITNYRSKWFNPPYMYDGEFYPNYLSGSGYVFTMDTARKLYNSSMDVPLFHLEDVYLTGLCAEKAGITPTNFHLFYDLTYDDVCEVVGMITRHQIIESKMKMAYDAIIRSDYVCSAPKGNVTDQLMEKLKKTN